MTVRESRWRERAAILFLASLFLVGLPSVVAAHAALDIATPPDGAVVAGTPPEVSGTFTQDLEVDGSSLQLRDANGDVIATGGVDPDDVRRMVIADLPELAPGEYEVRWTTLSAEDGELDRDTWTFTVSAAPTPSPTPSPIPTASSAAASPTQTSPAAPTAATSATVGPSPSPDETGEPTSGDSDILIPIVAALAIVAVAAVVLIRRRGPSSPPA